MTATAERASFVPARELSNGQPFHSPYGVFPFQADEVGEIIERTAPGRDSGHIPVFDTGTGKTIISLAAAAFLFADGMIDQMIVIAEQNVLEDWKDAAEGFTNLSAHVYHGTGREKRLAKAGIPHVFITSYETGARELVARENPNNKRKGRRLDGPLMGGLAVRSSRIFWVLDEVPKLQNRSSNLYQDYDYVLTQARKGPQQRVIGLTATPLNTDYSNGFNIGRQVCPEKMPAVGEFNRLAVKGHDDFGSPIYRPEFEPEFARMFQGIISRKRKSDPDVACYFPVQHERAIHVPLTGAHLEFYETIETLFDPAEGEDDPRNSREVHDDERRLWNLLRMTAGHPASHLHASNDTSRAIAEEIGPEALRSIGANKMPALIARLHAHRDRGWPVVVFSFFKNVLIEVGRELDEAGFSFVDYNGGMTRSAREKAKKTFLAGHTNVFLATDAASRGMNLQVSPAAIEYESASTFARRVQRLNRVHRITSPWSDVWCDTMILNETIEDGVINLAMDRNESEDTLVGDEEDESGFVSAETRRAMLRVKKRRKDRRP